MAEMRLYAGEEVTVTFTGPELQIEIDNHKTEGEMFVMCFKSYPNNYARRCPIGYASLYYLTSQWGITYRYYITRRGHLSDTSLTDVLGPIVFGKDGSITLLVYKLPSKCTLRVLNAAKVVPTTTTTTTTTTEKTTTTIASIKETSYKTVYFVIGGLALLLIIIIAVGIVWILWHRKTNATPPP
uniref:DOMON domain-containing protein n=1 Tax=Panagrellus redivivus TaxID=6233 RepID=A0A7E4V5N3_PANRE